MEFAQRIRVTSHGPRVTSESLDAEVAGRSPIAAKRAPSAGFSHGYALRVPDGPSQLAPFWQLVGTDANGCDACAAIAASLAKAPLVVLA